MPLAVRQEVARQLKDMQRAGVIRPSANSLVQPCSYGPKEGWDTALLR